MWWRKDVVPTRETAPLAVLKKDDDARPFPNNDEIDTAEAAATIFAERGFIGNGEAERGLMAIELREPLRVKDLAALKEQCSEEGVRLLVVRGNGLTISLWLDIAFGIKSWEFRALPLSQQSKKTLTSIRDVKRDDVLVFTCRETGDKLSVTVGRRIHARNIATQRAEEEAAAKATEDDGGQEEGVESLAGIEVTASIIDD